eukprot:SAG31_NODE_2477_length_5637_cov_10.057241_5_plen_101_part_00
MTEHFHNKLGYEGFIASDLGNIQAIWQNSAVAANYSDAVALSLWAGMDQVRLHRLSLRARNWHVDLRSALTFCPTSGIRALTHLGTALTLQRCTPQSLKA